MKFQLRKAEIYDMAAIFQLYASEYGDTYPNPIFMRTSLLEEAIKSEDRLIFVAQEIESKKIRGCLLFMYDQENFLAKAGAAVVHSRARGEGLTKKLILYGIDYIQENTSGLEVLYITTRTVHKAAQILTEKIGFKQLGIFPNVHKTQDYETHGLAALMFGEALAKRHIQYEQHPTVLPLFNIVRENIDLPQMKEAKIWNQKNYTGKVGILEVIEAKEFIKLRSKMLFEKKEIDLAFFPFHTPNLLITGPRQNIEVFAYVNEVDKHCVITGCKIDREVSFTDLFLAVNSILRDRGIRYIEIILRANRLNIIDKILKAKFLPCGYVPAFQLEGGKRYDYVVFSRSFEILDFNNLELTGSSAQYLKNYITSWEKTFLGNHFKNNHE
jgi:RimJ/RimL family protein N-acetyltransferase